MIVHLETIDHQGQLRDFAVLTDTLEQALDAASAIAVRADRVLTAHIIEDGIWTALPVEALNGQSISEPLQQLEVEWQQILNQSS